MHVRAVGLWAIMASACLAWAAGPGKVESIGPLTDTRAPEELRKILEPKGYRITQSDGVMWCELWVRENLPTEAASGVQGALFAQLPESMLLGVISVANAFTDYKGQSIKPGLYTMRYALLPDDGNHMGVAPSRDFVLLAPVAADNNPNTTLSAAELVKLSRQASATNHPVPLSLVQPEENTFQRLTSDFDGHVILAVKLKTQSGDLQMGFVVKGSGQ